jgi:hypothetical protein
MPDIVSIRTQPDTYSDFLGARLSLPLKELRNEYVPGEFDTMTFFSDRLDYVLPPLSVVEKNLDETAWLTNGERQSIRESAIYKVLGEGAKSNRYDYEQFVVLAAKLGADFWREGGKSDKRYSTMPSFAMARLTSDPHPVALTSFSMTTRIGTYVYWLPAIINTLPVEVSVGAFGYLAARIRFSLLANKKPSFIAMMRLISDETKDAVGDSWLFWGALGVALEIHLTNLEKWVVQMHALDIEPCLLREYFEAGISSPSVIAGGFEHGIDQEIINSLLN